MPIWSPDGSKIAFLYCCADGREALLVYRWK
jgi:hypothetical protein